MSKSAEYVLDRVFDAPQEMVWKAWTDPDILNRWYGPGAETIIHKFDLEPGGLWLNEMRYGENSMFQKVVFKEVEPPFKLVWHHHSATNSEWKDVTNPMMENWPRLLLTTVVFKGVDEKTNVRLSQVPIEATDSEIDCFASLMSGMDKGWGSGYTIMDEILAEMQKGKGIEDGQ